ncbi:hypothetical protein EBR96_11195, partial [bacterium]|nr:hypothetical protein [bacterium]
PSTRNGDAQQGRGPSRIVRAVLGFNKRAHFPGGKEPAWLDGYEVQWGWKYGASEQTRTGRLRPGPGQDEDAFLRCVCKTISTNPSPGHAGAWASKRLHMAWVHMKCL